jgi:hypothetical protein
MRELVEVRGDPYAGVELATELRRIHGESVAYWSGYDTTSFFRRPAPEVWAPVDQVRHLTTSIRAVTRGLTIPRVVLFFRFGPSRRPSRRLEQVRADYRARLARGGGAGRFAPRALAASEADEANRTRIMTRHADAVGDMANAVGRWSERALDRYRLPHPLLGSLTVREMLLFTVIHNVHHVHVAERRRVGDAARAPHEVTP